MTYINALKKILQLPRSSGAPTLERMRLLCRYLGDPQKKLKFVHIAGTNGKGSCAAMLDTVLREAGYRTGRFISPYVLDFRERMTVDGEMITHDELCIHASAVFRAMSEMERDVERAARGERTLFPIPKQMSDGTISASPVQFEVVTAIGFLFFKAHRCDAVVLECGLGGRFDATNVIDPPMAAVIMKIGLDHTEFLGDTVEKIAAEKCGIIKNGTPEVISCTQLPEVRAVISKTCVSTGSRLTVPLIFDMKLIRASLGGLEFSYRGEVYKTRLAASYQVDNASTVIEICDALSRVGMKIPTRAVKSGIEATVFPARFEVLGASPAVIVDGAHNASGIEALCGSIANIADSIRGKVTFIVGMLNDKGPEKALETFAEFLRTETVRTSSVITIMPENPRAMSAENLASVIRALTFNSVETVAVTERGKEGAKKIISLLCDVGRDDAVIMFGSLYLASEMRDVLRVFLEGREQS